MSRKRRRFELHPSRLFPVTFSRLLDHELSVLTPYVEPIEPSRGGASAPRRDRETLILPAVFVAAEELLGPSSGCIDPHKSSFRFPLVVEAVKGDHDLRYLLIIEDVRATVTVSVFRIGDEPREGALREYRPPLDSELSRADMDYLTSYLLRHLRGVGESLAVMAQPFHRLIPCEYVAYGKRRGELFEEVFADADAYAEGTSRIAAELAEHERQRDRDRVRALLSDVADGTLQF